MINENSAERLQNEFPSSSLDGQGPSESTIFASQLPPTEVTNKLDSIPKTSRVIKRRRKVRFSPYLDTRYYLADTPQMECSKVCVSPGSSNPATVTTILKPIIKTPGCGIKQVLTARVRKVRFNPFISIRYFKETEEELAERRQRMQYLRDNYINPLSGYEADEDESSSDEEESFYEGYSSHESPLLSILSDLIEQSENKSDAQIGTEPHIAGITEEE